MSQKHFKVVKALLLLCVLSALACSSGQEKAKAVILIPEGYQLMDTDTFSAYDKTFVINALQRIDEDSLIQEVVEVPRPLMILEKKDDRSFNIMARNDHVILCGICGGVMGDPFDGIKAGKTGFSISYFGGSRFRWTRETRFDYDPEKGQWILMNDHGQGFDSFDPEGNPDDIEYTSKDSIGIMTFTGFNVNGH